LQRRADRAAGPHFYGPAVLALILQHLAITLIALALVRERTSGVIELFRVAPIKAGEVIVGKVLAYLLIGGLIAALTITLLIVGFGIPLLGDPVSLAAAIALLLLASLGIGLVVAVISDSEREAVQLSLCFLWPRSSSAVRGGHLGVRRTDPDPRLHAAGDPRDPAHPGHHAARLDDAAWDTGALMLIAAVTLTGGWLAALRAGCAR
jgi:hypothetical protein